MYKCNICSDPAHSTVHLSRQHMSADTRASTTKYYIKNVIDKQVRSFATTQSGSEGYFQRWKCDFLAYK